MCRNIQSILYRIIGIIQVPFLTAYHEVRKSTYEGDEREKCICQSINANSLKQEFIMTSFFTIEQKYSFFEKYTLLSSQASSELDQGADWPSLPGLPSLY